jgi:hypothetical protein
MIKVGVRVFRVYVLPLYPQVGVAHLGQGPGCGGNHALCCQLRPFPDTSG